MRTCLLANRLCTAKQNAASFGNHHTPLAKSLPYQCRWLQIASAHLAYADGLDEHAGKSSEDNK